MKTAEEAIQLYDNADDPHKAMAEIQSDALREAAEIAGERVQEFTSDQGRYASITIRDAILARVKELEGK